MEQAPETSGRPSERPIEVTRRQMVVGGVLLGAGVVGGAVRLSHGAGPSRLTVGMPIPYDNLDPQSDYNNWLLVASVNLYDNLYRYEGNPPQVVPWLAERHEVSSDGLRWTFYLRRNAKFHDGSEVTAEAVRYSVERLMAMGKGAAASAFKPVMDKNSARVVDKHTVEIKLSQPSGAFLAMMPLLFIVNPALVKANEAGDEYGAKWLASNVAGSGPFRLAAHSPATGFTLERFKDHWRKPVDRAVDVVEVRTIREPASRVLSLQRGDTLIGDSYLPPEQIERLAQSSNLRIIREESLRVFLITMNNKKGPLADANVRRAISSAFNYDGFIKDMSKGTYIRAVGPMSSKMWGFPKDVQGYSYDLNKAREYLSKASVKITRPLEIHVQAGSDVGTTVATLLQSDLAKIGIELKVIQSPWPTLAGSFKSPETAPEMWVHWVAAHYVDPDNWVGQMYDSSLWGTFKSSAFYQNTEVDKLLREARQLVDQSRRAKLYEDAVRRIVADAPAIYIGNDVEMIPVSRRVKGFAFTPTASGNLFWNLSVED